MALILALAICPFLGYENFFPRMTPVFLHGDTDNTHNELIHNTNMSADKSSRKFLLKVFKAQLGNESVLIKPTRPR